MLLNHSNFKVMLISNPCTQIKHRPIISGDTSHISNSLPYNRPSILLQILQIHIRKGWRKCDVYCMQISLNWVLCPTQKMRNMPLRGFINGKLGCVKLQIWKQLNVLSNLFLSQSGDLGIGLVWDNHPHRTPPRLFGLSVEILFKVN